MVKRLRKLNRRILLLVAGLVLILAVLGLGWARYHKTAAPATGSSLNPATAAEQQAAIDAKNKIVQDQKNQATAPSLTMKTVSVVISSVTSTDLRGYASGVLEDSGACTATATKGSQAFTKTSTGFKNVSYTSCAPIYWDSTLSSGTWTINLSYKSATAQGSTSQTIEVK